MKRNSRLFVISGPSGVGKGTLVKLLREQRPDLGLTVSATTRKPRVGEVPDVSYHYLSEDEFARKIEAGEFLEWADVHGHRYGTLLSEVTACINEGRSVILEIDVQGGLNVRHAYADAVLIFVAPPSLDELEARLRGRATEDDEQVRLRLANAAGEMALAKSYDVVVVNDELDESVARLRDVIESYESEKGIASWQS